MFERYIVSIFFIFFFFFLPYILTRFGTAVPASGELAKLTYCIWRMQRYLPIAQVTNQNASINFNKRRLE
jgi:hypothetical protein